MDEASAVILVVDDNEMNRDMLSRRLQRQGYKIVLAEDGERALDILRQQTFDLVMLDIMMPKMNGYEVLEHLKADPQLYHIPVIMISAVDDLDSVVKCIEMGAEDYLFKPFNPVLLKARVTATLEKRRLHEHILPPQVLDSLGAAKEEVAKLMATSLDDVNLQTYQNTLIQLQNHLQKIESHLEKWGAHS